MEIRIYSRMPDEAYSIRKAVFVDEQGFIDEFEDYDNEGIGIHLVLFDNGQPLATCRYYYISDDDSFRLGRMAVVKEARGRHLGHAIMTAAENEIIKTGGRRMTVSAQLHAKGFYEKQGFTAEGDVYPEQGVSHILMVKELPFTVGAAQMKDIERQADAEGLSYYQMMENAGTSAYTIIKDSYPAAKSIIVFAGKGNNGGDGFVVARLAANEGKKVTVVLTEGDPVTADAGRNYSLLQDLPVKITRLENMPSSVADETIQEPSADVVVDALYGTGFHGSLRPSGAHACSLMNKSPAPVVALDIPSGLNCDSGIAAEGAVRADLTITFHALKRAHVMTGSKNCCGRILVADIGIAAD